MKTLKELRGRINVVASEMSALAQKAERSDDEESKLDQLLVEFNELGPQIERLAAVEEAAGRAAKYGESAGRVAGAEALAGQNGDGKGQGGRQVDRRSPGQKFAESEAVKRYIAGGFTGKSERVPLGSADAAGRWSYDGNGPTDRYTLIDSGDLPGFMVPPMVVPDIKRPRDYALTARDVLINGRTNSDTIYFLRELAFTNSAAETAEATSYDVTALGSGGRKPESALTFEEASVPVVTIAHWMPITRQALEDTAQLQTYVEDRLMVGLERRENTQIWNGAGGGTNMTGIVNTSGVQALNAAAFVASPVTNAGTDNENFERVLRAATEIELTGDAQMTFLAMNPRDIEKFQTITDDNGQYMGAGPYGASAVSRLWGYPIARDRGITEGTVVAGDGTMAVIFDRSGPDTITGYINDQLVRNMLTILVEKRVALAVFRPAAFAVVTLAAW